MKFDFKDISLVPNKITRISSRDKVNARTVRNFLPIMAAPMDTVVNVNNANEYVINGIMPCLPRLGEGVSPRFNNDSMFVSMSLNDFSFFLDELINQIQSCLLLQCRLCRVQILLPCPSPTYTFSLQCLTLQQRREEDTACPSSSSSDCGSP